MLKQIKKLEKVTNERDFVEAYRLLHFYLDRGQATNGNIVLDLPGFDKWKFDVPAKEFLAVIEAAGSDVEFSIKENSVFVFKDNFKAKVPRSKQPFPMKQIDGEEHKAPENFVEALRLLRPFMALEAHRPFTSTVRVSYGKAMAANGASAAEIPTPGCPDLILPMYGVDFLLNYEYEPDYIYLTDQTIYFSFEDDSWAGIQLLHAQWPDLTLFRDYNFEALPTIPDGFSEKIEALMPIFKIIGDKRLFMDEDKIRTADGDYYAEQLVQGLSKGLYSVSNFYLCAMNATNADFTLYPKAIPLKDSTTGMNIIMMGMAEN